jgi:hypothetical protein
VARTEVLVDGFRAARDPGVLVASDFPRPPQSALDAIVDEVGRCTTLPLPGTS